MIRHIVFFTARSGDDVDAICDGLALLGTIPHSAHFEVSRNNKVDQISNEVDVVVYAEFADAEALAAYKTYPSDLCRGNAPGQASAGAAPVSGRCGKIKRRALGPALETKFVCKIRRFA